MYSFKQLAVGLLLREQPFVAVASVAAAVVLTFTFCPYTFFCPVKADNGVKLNAGSMDCVSVSNGCFNCIAFVPS